MALAHVSRVWQWGSVGVAKCVRRREVRCLFVVFPLKQFVNQTLPPFHSEDIFMECLA